ncbi:hypothetical protein AU195_06570 [Mycobacterium sp. IS-1496]|nr:hypothetical protein AU195_06570 [Mycobacterium sp. IS-1496]
MEAGQLERDEFAEGPFCGARTRKSWEQSAELLSLLPYRIGHSVRGQHDHRVRGYEGDISDQLSTISRKCVSDVADQPTGLLGGGVSEPANKSGSEIYSQRVAVAD